MSKRRANTVIRRWTLLADLPKDLERPFSRRSKSCSALQSSLLAINTYSTTDANYIYFIVLVLTTVTVQNIHLYSYRFPVSIALSPIPPSPMRAPRRPLTDSADHGSVQEYHSSANAPCRPTNQQHAHPCGPPPPHLDGCTYSARVS